MKVAHDAGVRDNVAHTTAALLARLGVSHAFGIIGGGIAPFADALDGRIPMVHCRHEAGAAFAAAECSLASGRPAAVFVTTGPGLMNALNGLVAARWEGAHVVLVSSVTSPVLRGRHSFQETTTDFLPANMFDYVAVPNTPEELATIEARLAEGFQRPNGFLANVGLSRTFQTLPAPPITPRPHLSMTPRNCDATAIAKMLVSSRFAIWVGHGARHSADQVRLLAARSGAPVMSSPRGKGVFPEANPQYLGVTGLGGDDLVSALRTYDPEYTLVLGTRLGEFTSFWDPSLLPSKAFIHVDVDPSVFGAAYPDFPTHGVHCEISTVLRDLLGVWPKIGARPSIRRATALAPERRVSSTQRVSRPAADKVRASALMNAIQSVVVEGSDAIVMTEAGNAFAWGRGSFRVDAPRYRVSTGWGSMGQAAAGVLGASLGSGRKAVAVLGDGAMLMQSEVSTAVQYGIPVVWVVLNDARYGMIERGMTIEGLDPKGTSFPEVDFVAFARSMGATGERVTDEADLEGALFRAMAHPGPFVVDVVIDPNESAPIAQRIASLQGHS